MPNLRTKVYNSKCNIHHLLVLQDSMIIKIKMSQYQGLKNFIMPMVIRNKTNINTACLVEDLYQEVTEQIIHFMGKIPSKNQELQIHIILQWILEEVYSTLNNFFRKKWFSWSVIKKITSGILSKKLILTDKKLANNSKTWKQNLFILFKTSKSLFKPNLINLIWILSENIDNSNSKCKIWEMLERFF